MSESTPKRRFAGIILRVILSIILLWGFGMTLLVVILNLRIGFASTKTEFNDNFLSMTEADEYDMLDSYIQLAVQRQRAESGEPSDMAAESEPLLHFFETRYRPDNTNFRFTVTDSNGGVLLTNFPENPKDSDLLVSDLYTSEVEIQQRPTLIQKHFDDPAENFQSVVYGDMSGLLDDPSEFDIWYFSDYRVDEAYHQGFPAVTLRKTGTEIEHFKSENEAEHFDFSERYGQYSEWRILPDSTDSGNAGKKQVNVEVTVYEVEQTQHLMLDAYYDMRRNGELVQAADPELEELLSEGLDITIRALQRETVFCYIRTALPAVMPADDTIRSDYAVYSFVFQQSDWILTAMFLLMILTAVSCISLCSAAGHIEDEKQITVSMIHSMAYEIFWILPPLSLFAGMPPLNLLQRNNAPYRIIAIYIIGAILCIAAFTILWLYTTAVRVKAGTFWRSFGCVRLFRRVFALFRNKTVTCIFAFFYCLLTCAVNMAAWRTLEPGGIGLAVLLDGILLFLILYSIYAYFELHRHVQQIRQGNFEPAAHPVRLAGDFARFDRSLDEITGSVSEIVAKQTKAEHLRTELITNVSHDLKTPLTSIVNYVDLLSREPMHTEAAAEYLDVLKRQAARLKKLTVDLVDASKAATGNLTVELMPTDVQVLIGQLAAEYDELLQSRSLTLVQNVPDKPLMILADGRQLSRVFDNLLNNAGKYALPGTRLYLDVTEDAENIRISLKNVSAVPLNVSPEELMERFVRGDASRSSEGSGLGLTIARDLTALQNGTLTIETDGDLFKAILTFPRRVEPAADSLRPQDTSLSPQ